MQQYDVYNEQGNENYLETNYDLYYYYIYLIIVCSQSTYLESDTFLFHEKGTTHPEMILLRAEVPLGTSCNVVTARRGTHQKLFPIFVWHDYLH